eukprot:COSAG05_NODE_1840_length_3984_cov_2.130759_2_plen_91_part_00
MTRHPHTAARETPPVVRANAATMGSDQQKDGGGDKARERVEVPSPRQQYNVAAGRDDGRRQHHRSRGWPMATGTLSTSALLSEKGWNLVK